MKQYIFKSGATVAICLLFLLTVIACSKEKNEEKYIVTVDKSEIILAGEADSQTLEIVSTGDWHIEAEGLESYLGATAGSTDWYFIDRIYGVGNATISISFKENNLTNQSTILNIVGKYNRVEVVLKQQENE